MTTSNQICNEHIAVEPRGFLSSLLQVVRHQLSIQQLKADVQRERRQLAELSPTQLNDIGISHADAAAEADRRDLPAQRLVALLEQNRG